jgi:hypothetical protein
MVMQLCACIGLSLGFGVGIGSVVPTVDVPLPEGEIAVYRGVLDSGERSYYYGTIQIPGALTEYDGLLVIVEKTKGVLVETIRVETGFLECIEYMGVFGDGTFFLVVERFFVDPESLMPWVEDLLVLTIDINGDVLDQTSFPRHMESYHNHGNLLIMVEKNHSLPILAMDSEGETTPLPSMASVYTGIFDYQFQGFARLNGEDVESIHLSSPGEYDILISDGGYEYGFSFRLEPDTGGIEDGGEYLAPLVLDCSGDLFLNGEPIAAMTVLSVPGYYELRIDGIGDFTETFHFTVHPTVENVYSGLVTTEPLHIFANGLSMTLNGVDFTSGNLLSMPGIYTLVITGVNGYSLSINFTFNPSFSGVEDGMTYDVPVTIYAMGVATINGKRTDANPIEITTPGSYELALWLEGDRFETVRFSIANPVSEPLETGTDWLLIVEETVLGIAVLVGLFLLLKKK